MPMTANVVTRFAPSPTGFLHIGGARTALFNWLYARRMGGQMRLRIEDTDRARSSEAAIEAILDGLNWLGIEADGEIVYQHTQAERHVEIANQLLEQGHAYRCYATPEELNEMRALARAEGRPPGYDGRWRDRDPAEAPDGVAPAIRLKSPTEGKTIVADHVQGDVVFANTQLDDLVLLRSDGSPTYMLAVVVDDHDMGVTHVVRGDDHLTNAARQALIYQALGWPVPQVAHIPLIHGPDGAKLSKRHGALGVDAYRAMGYLPETMRNALVRLGWSHGDDEIISTAQMIDWFDLGGINKAAARLDYAKLENLNGHYIREMDNAKLLNALLEALPHLPGHDVWPSPLDETMMNRLTLALPSLKSRAKTLVDLVIGAEFLFAARPIPIEDKPTKALQKENAAGILKGVAAVLEDLPQWTADDLEPTVRAYGETTGVKFGDIAQPLRAALTGKSVSPGIFDVLLALGREESLGRIADQVQITNT